MLRILRRVLFVLAVAGSILWGVAFAAAGILLCASIVGIIPGILCLILCGAPLAYLFNRSVNQYSERAWAEKKRSKPMPNDEEKPWML